MVNQNVAIHCIYIIQILNSVYKYNEEKYMYRYIAEEVNTCITNTYIFIETFILCGKNKLKSIKNQIFSGNKNTDKKYVFD